MRLLICIQILCTISFSIFAQNHKKIHRKAILIDTHNDIPSSSIEKNVQFDTDLLGKTHTDLNRMKQGGIDVEIFSIFCGPDQANPFSFANRQIDSVYEWVRRNPEKMMIVKNVAELQQSVKEKKIGAMLGVEGGHFIEDNISNLDSLYERGVRYMTLTWNNSTTWATSAKDETEKKDSLSQKGLTELGKQIVQRMNQLGMLVDISHVGEQTFWDVIRATTKPIIASHSNVYNLCPHRRNLKDEQIKAIGKNGGVIHLNFYAGFLDSTYEKPVQEFMKRHKKERDELIANNTQRDYANIIIAEKYKSELDSLRPPLSTLIDHMDYIVKMIGVDHVGFGSDFDGIEAGPIELNGVQDFPLITKAMLKRGYSKKDIRKIMGGNFIRVFSAAQTHKTQKK